MNEAFNDLRDRIFGWDRFWEFQRIGWEVVDYQFVRLLASWERKHADAVAKNSAMAPKIVRLGDDEFVIFTDDFPRRLVGAIPSPAKMRGDPDFAPIAEAILTMRDTCAMLA